VEDDSPASRAGLAQGDLIVQAAGRPVSGADDLYQALDSAAGGEIELALLRGTDDRTVRVRLGGQPGDADDRNG
jgi:S1-C subfamily serine protease